jgi:hypothetical protein
MLVSSKDPKNKDSAGKSTRRNNSVLVLASLIFTTIFLLVFPLIPVSLTVLHQIKAQSQGQFNPLAPHLFSSPNPLQSLLDSFSSEVLVIWDIACLQLFHIPTDWLKTFQCSIAPFKETPDTKPTPLRLTADFQIPSTCSSATVSRETFTSIVARNHSRLSTPPTQEMDSLLFENESDQTVEGLSRKEKMSLVEQPASSSSTKIIVDKCVFCSYSIEAESIRHKETFGSHVIESEGNGVEAKHNHFQSSREHRHSTSPPNTKSRILYQDDSVLVFHDINPSASVHLLVIPTTHIESVMNLSASHLSLLRHMRKVGVRTSVKNC